MFKGLISKLRNKHGFSAGASQSTILVVDDSQVDRAYIQYTLEKRGYRILTAVNGAAGLETIKSDRPDLIILDCQMPVMDGLTMCKKLKENDKTSGIPVIFLTALDTPQNIVSCFESDCENYLSKPVSGKILVTQVEAILKESSSA